jgi:ATP-dependent Clp protease protease subunit
MLKKFFYLLASLFLIQESSARTITLTSNNFVSLVGPITKDLVVDTIKSLNQKNINEYMTENKNINIYINSPGGSVFAGNHLIQYIKTLQGENINVSCIGQNFMSMAFIIMQACNKRYVLFDSIGMQHQISLGVKGDIENFKTYFNFIERVNDLLINMETKKIGLDIEKYLSNIMNDWWLFGYENVENNVADELINLKCSQLIIHEKVKQRNNINGAEFYVEGSKCPMINDLVISNRNMTKYYDTDNYSLNVKKILNDFKV